MFLYITKVLSCVNIRNGVWTPLRCTVLVEEFGEAELICLSVLPFFSCQSNKPDINYPSVIYMETSSRMESYSMFLACNLSYTNHQLVPYPCLQISIKIFVPLILWFNLSDPGAPKDLPWSRLDHIWFSSQEPRIIGKLEYGCCIDHKVPIPDFIFSWD